jgi:DNA (cytosine-5)-methyltransferase 1
MAGLLNPTTGRIGNHVSLFAGIGATDIAVEAAGWHTIVTAEIDTWCRQLLELRYPDALHLPDVQSVTGFTIDRTLPLMISGGFPCQGISGPGTGKGFMDPRSALWFEFARVIREYLPDKVLIENSPMLRTRGLSQILVSLSYMGYDARWDCIPAASVGAPHIRDRIFILADRYSSGGASLWPPMPLNMPRAGSMAAGRVRERTPLATIKQSKKLSIAPRMYPTPTRSDGTGGPGTTPKRTGGKNLRTVVAELEGNGRLNPMFVEWMMGLPVGWTSLDTPNAMLYPHPGWDKEHFNRTSDYRAKDRGGRIRALGNSLVPQAAQVALTSL